MFKPTLNFLFNLSHSFSKLSRNIIIPHETSWGGYNVFDPSVSLSGSPVFLVSATPLKPLNRIS